MPRKARVHLTGAIYHVMFRGNYRQDIFLSDADRMRFYEYLSDACDTYGCKIHLFCLMSNHVHLAIEVGHVPLSKIMQSIKSRYARYFNKIMRNKGHLFEERYKAVLVQSEDYLLELCFYLHMNPVRSKIVSDPKNYMWSSHHAYSQTEKISWLTTDFVLETIKRSVSVDEQHYLYFMHDQKGVYKKPNFFSIDEHGSWTICDQVNKHYRKNMKSKELHCLSLDQIIDVVCDVMHIKHDLLTSASLRRDVVIARAIITYFAHYRAGYALGYIGLALQRRGDGVSRAAHRIMASVQNNPKLQRLFTELENRLLLVDGA